MPKLLAVKYFVSPIPNALGRRFAFLSTLGNCTARVDKNYTSQLCLCSQYFNQVYILLPDEAYPSYVLEPACRHLQSPQVSCRLFSFEHCCHCNRLEYNTRHCSIQDSKAKSKSRAVMHPLRLGPLRVYIRLETSVDRLGDGDT